MCSIALSQKYFVLIIKEDDFRDLVLKKLPFIFTNIIDTVNYLQVIHKALGDIFTSFQYSYYAIQAKSFHIHSVKGWLLKLSLPY